jgi:hypothetical protein
LLPIGAPATLYFMDETYQLAVLTLITAAPSIIAAIVAYLLARFTSRHAFLRSRNLTRSYLLGASVFLIADFLIPIILLYSLSLLPQFQNNPALGIIFMLAGPYRVWLGWGLIVLGLILLYFPLRKLHRLNAAIPATAIPATQPILFRALPILLICAALVVLYPLYKMYRNHQLLQEMQTKMQQVREKTTGIVDTNARTIQAGLDHYYLANGIYPATLNELIPTYLEKMPVDPRANDPEYTANAARTDYRLCVYYDIGKKCFIKSTNTWSPLRLFCRDQKKSYPDEDCQIRHTPEANPF